jgi:predicted Zn-dependent protease
VKRPAVMVGVALLMIGGAAFLYSARRDAAEAKRKDELEYAAQWDLDHGQAAQALEKMNALVQRDPTRKAVPRLLGRALVSTGAPVEGIVKLNQALAANPADAEAHEYLGVARAQLGAATEAKMALTKALEFEPRRVSAWRRLAQVCLTTGDAAAATEAWRQAMAHAEPQDREAIRTEASTLLELAGKAEEARAFSKHSDDLYPSLSKEPHVDRIGDAAR